MSLTKLSIDNMHCGSCVAAVSDAIRTIDSDEPKDVSVGLAEITYAPAKTSPQSLAQAITGAGYPAQVAETDDKGDAGAKGCGCCT